MIQRRSTAAPKSTPAPEQPAGPQWISREVIVSCEVCGNVNFSLIKYDGKGVSVWCTKCGKKYEVILTTPHTFKEVADGKNTVAHVLLNQAQGATA